MRGRSAMIGMGGGSSGRTVHRRAGCTARPAPVVHEDVQVAAPRPHRDVGVVAKGVECPLESVGIVWTEPGRRNGRTRSRLQAAMNSSTAGARLGTPRSPGDYWRSVGDPLTAP